VPDPVLGDLAPKQARVRFAPSPTGFMHVGGVRTALFNWAFARHNGGTLVLRLEDTDLARSTEEADRYVIDSLRWLGLDWDEGPEVGGPFGPYRQSERLDIYADVVNRLLEAAKVYRCYCSQEELDERREAARSLGRTPGYDGHCRALTEEQVAAFVAAGREPVLRMRMPASPVTFDDLVRGEITFQPEHVPDFVLVRANGQPLYTLVNPVDDALMQITHVLRGEDLLSSTPRQIALHDALRSIGIGHGPPRFGHLPFVMGEGNRKLSKRDPGSGLDEYVARGFVPEGLLNYLALLGWSIADDRDVFTMDEMVEAFDIRRVNPNPARFDPRKCEAINAAHVRALPIEDLTLRLVPILQRAGLLSDPPGEDQLDLLRRAAPLVQERITALGEAVDMLGFLFVPESRFSLDPDDAAKVLTPDGLAVVKASHDALVGLGEWTSAEIEAALRGALVEEMGLKPRHAFGPVRVAISGRRVSPPLFESMELLGRERSMSRLQRAQSASGAAE
jgi:glutamyl-tRNA synthetase